MTDGKEKIKIPIPVAVEGKYDKMKLTEVIDAHIVVTDGFGIFNNKERLSLIKTLSKDGIVLLLDSDGAGGVIRSRIMSAVPKEKIFNLYIPKIPGKEKRKSHGSKEGILGVEGMDVEVLYGLFSNFQKTLENRLTGDLGKRGHEVTKADFYEDGLSGRDDSSKKRDRLARYFDLPDKMTAPALLGAVNILTDHKGYKAALTAIEEE